MRPRRPAGQRVVPGTAVQRVDAGVAEDQLRVLVAGERDCVRISRAGCPQRFDLDASRDRVAELRGDRVVPAANRLHNLVAGCA
jgi:hypothetical protein